MIGVAGECSVPLLAAPDQKLRKLPQRLKGLADRGAGTAGHFLESADAGECAALIADRHIETDIDEPLADRQSGPEHLAGKKCVPLLQHVQIAGIDMLPLHHVLFALAVVAGAGNRDISGALKLLRRAADDVGRDPRQLGQLTAGLTADAKCVAVSVEHAADEPGSPAQVQVPEQLVGEFELVHEDLSFLHIQF